MLMPLLLFCLFPALLYGFWVFDQIVKLEYEAHRKQWEQDGRPHGFFWIP